MEIRNAYITEETIQHEMGDYEVVYFLHLSKTKYDAFKELGFEVEENGGDYRIEVTPYVDLNGRKSTNLDDYYTKSYFVEKENIDISFDVLTTSEGTNLYFDIKNNIKEHFYIGDMEVREGDEFTAYKFSYSKNNGFTVEEFNTKVMKDTRGRDDSLYFKHNTQSYSLHTLNNAKCAEPAINSFMIASDIKLFEKFREIKSNMMKEKVDDFKSKMLEANSQLDYINNYNLEVQNNEVG